MKRSLRLTTVSLLVFPVLTACTAKLCGIVDELGLEWGRGDQDAGAVRRSGVFSGRQVPLEMGKVRVGGSGRPVPAVFSAAASRRPVTSSLEAVAVSPAALSPRVTLERHPRSPFRRQEELSKTVVRVQEDASSSRFHVNKVIEPQSLNAHSPQIRFKGDRSKSSEFGARSAETTRSQGDGVELSTSGDGNLTVQVEQTIRSQLRDQAVSRAMDQQNMNKEDQSTRDRKYVPAVDLMLMEEHKEEVSASVSEAKALRADPENIQPPEFSNRKALELPTAKAGAGTFVSSMPSLTKLRSTFTARELALFTQRLDTTVSEGNAQTRYHVTSHPHATPAPISSLAHQANENHVGNRAKGVTHKRTLSASARRVSSLPDDNHQVESSWRRVDTSIDHIYEDPSTDMVQLHLLHSHHSASGQKKRKMMERERVLAAASGLREHQSEEQRRQEQLQQRKLQLQKMSEAIRLQNQRAVRAKGSRSTGQDEGQMKKGRRSECAPSLPERKPAVPRLSRTGASARQQQPKQKRKPKDEASRPQGGISASILMGLTSSMSVTTTQRKADDAAAGEEDTTLPVEHLHTVKRRPPVTTPRLSKKKKQGVTTQPSENDAALRAKEERRAIAREYMQLQKHSRRIWSAKAKEQSQREQEKRQQQLEILEATRLKNLRLSKKRVKDRKKNEIDDPVLSSDFRTTTVAISAAPVVNQAQQDNSSDTSVKLRSGSNDRRSEKELDLDESDLDGENDQSIGNVWAQEGSVHYDTRKSSPIATSTNVSASEKEAEQDPEAEQGTGADDRVRKLLELREKAAALSARLSGLRNRTDTTTSTDSAKEMFGTHERERLEININDNTMPSDGEIEVSSRKNTAVANFDDHQYSSGCENAEHVRERSAVHSESDVDQQSEGRSEPAIRRRSDSAREQNSSRVSDRDEFAPYSLVDVKHESLIITNTQQTIQQDRASIDTFDAVGTYNDNDDGNIDVRSIGVYNIGAVWPIPQQEEAAELVYESKQLSSVSSSSSSSSAASSPLGSPSMPRGDGWHSQFDESRDEEKGNSEEAFEMDYYQQLKNRLGKSSNLVGGDRNGDTALDWNESGENAQSDSGSDVDSLLGSYPVHSSHRKYPRTGQSVVQRRRTDDTSSPPNTGLMRLIRETDDSLSVIDRAAKKLYREQRDRSEREKEQELQRRIQAEKKELIEKDMALETVMASLTGKKLNREASDSEDDPDVQSGDDENEIQSTQYKRLEEIMDEVEKERAQESNETGVALPGEQMPGDSDRNTIRQPNPTCVREPLSNKHQSDGMPTSPSSVFWDHMVSTSAGNEFNYFLDHDRPRVKIDDSELVAQREARLQEDDEQKTGHIHSPPRVHSPRTLSRRLMAAVDYQEAIFDAHIQLSTMEHAHEVETVQAETITLAEAFKEEMEHNAMSHQLALDHVTLEKKFDGDMHDVLQQLDTIRQVEEQERTANASRVEQELRQANLRECSVQTEALQRADATTSAVLYVDTSTSPVRSVVDASVQHDTAQQTTGVASSVAGLDHDLEYASGGHDDAYEETFEKESQLQVETHIRNNTSASDIAESLTRSPPQSEKDNSEIQSVLSEDDDDFEESGVAKTIADEESFADESGVVSAAGSTIHDEVYDNESNHSTPSRDEVSMSMEYEDDFEASSPKMRAVPNRSARTSKGDSVEDGVQDELDFSESSENGENREDIEEYVGGKAASAKSCEEIVSDVAETNLNFSQFEDKSQDDPKRTKKSVTKYPEISTALRNQHQHSAGTAPSVTPEDMKLNTIPTSGSVAAAYILDLERRKQAEESLLNLRLQTVEQRFRHEVKQFESDIGNAQLDARSVHELKMRKETLMMAYLAEKANVDSLRSASTARYYQDLHAFRSLSLDWPHSGIRDDNQGQSYYSERLRTAPSPVRVPPPSNTDLTKSLGGASAPQSDEYADDFASDAGNGHAVVDGDISSHGIADIGESGSIVFEHSDANDNSSEPSDVHDASDVAEEEYLEQEADKDASNSVEEEEDQYEDEFASMSEDTSVQKKPIVDVERDESNEIADQAESNGARNDSEYDEDFASISDSTPVQMSGPPKSSATMEAEVEEQDIKESGSPSDAGEISSGSEIADDESSHHASDKEVGGDDNVESDQQNYSADDFESGQLKQFATLHSENVLGEQSVSVREGQSSSEDSSTTKLLVAELATLQQATGESYSARALAEDCKLAKKKAKIDELLQVKERLLDQQKGVFRLDEEKRQVDVIAKLALGMDVESELRQAKAEIAQQLASEFDALQQTYPMLKAAHQIGTATTLDASKPSGPSAVQQQLSQGGAPSPVVSTVMSKLFGKASGVQFSVAEDGYDEGNEEYEAESFEEEQYESHMDIASDEVQEVESRQQDGVLSEDEEVEDYSNSDVASEVPSLQSGMDEDIVPSVIDEEGHTVDEQDASRSQAESEDYENDYENESFDAAQSASEIHSDSLQGEPAQREEHNAESVEGVPDKAEYDEDEYSDEGFDSASGSFSSAAPLALETTTSPSAPHDTPISEVTIAEVSVAVEEDSAKEEELAVAIETVVAQLAGEKVTDPVSPPQHEPGPVIESTTGMNESTSLITSVSVSMSRDEEVESLTKSIEERTVRLQALKQKIADRKSDILAVHKQMRVEQHKERLVAEEKLLWSEMESIERLLCADEAALALCSQRNRLEIVHLEAKQLEHSVGGKANNGACDLGGDLLAGFEYVEKAQIDGHQQQYLTDVPSTPRRGYGLSGYDLLGGYAYVEVSEPINSVSAGVVTHEGTSKANVDNMGSIFYDAYDDRMATVTHVIVNREGIDSQERSDIGREDGKEGAAGEQDTSSREHKALAHSISEYAESYDLQENDEHCAMVTDDLHGADEATVEDVNHPVSQREQEPDSSSALILPETRVQQVNELDISEEFPSSKLRQDSFGQQNTLDLLAGYTFVEVAEAVSDIQANIDLLNGFDYVEIVEAVESSPLDNYRAEDVCTSEDHFDYTDGNHEDLKEFNSTTGDLGDDKTWEDGHYEVYQTTAALPEALIPALVETPTKLEETDIDGEARGDDVEESIDNEETAEELDDLDPIDTAIVVNSDPRAFPNKNPPSDDSPTEEVADRVASLLFVDLFQELEEDIITTISYRRNVQHQSDEDKLQESMEDIPQILVPVPFSDGIDSQISELGQESVNSHYTSDWGVDQSSESVLAGSTNIVPPNKASHEDVAEKEARGDFPTIDKPVEPANILEESSFDNLSHLSGDDEAPSETPELAEGSLGDSNEDGRFKGTTNNVVSSMGAQGGVFPAKYVDEEVSLNPSPKADMVLKRERVADAIFATVYDEIMDSELQFWPRQQPIAPSASTSQAAVNRSKEFRVTAPSSVRTTFEATKPVPVEGPRARGRAVAQKLVDQLEIVDGDIRLPAYGNLEVKSDSSTSRVLYDAVEDLSRDCFNAIQQSASSELTLDNASMLAVIHRHVQAEIDELLAVREQSEHELERQLQLISDESGAETGLTGDVLLSQNCVESNVNTIVSKVQAELSRTTETLSAAVQPAHPALLPRTPISRVKSTSILSSLQAQQDQELQQRITGMILRDLLLDAGLP